MLRHHQNVYNKGNMDSLNGNTNIEFDQEVSTKIDQVRLKIGIENAKPNGIAVRRLNTTILIEQACSLLYEVYIQQQNWQFCPDNPSKLRVETRNGKKVLIDKYIDRAIWFGAFENEKLVGCMRLLGVDENNQLEFETYPSSQLARAHIQINEKKRCFELQKGAINENYVGSGIVKRLFLACFQFCQENQYHVAATTHHEYLKSLFNKLAFPLKQEQAFKYEPQDPSAVNLYFANYYKSTINLRLMRS